MMDAVIFFRTISNLGAAMPDATHLQPLAAILVHFAWQGFAITTTCWALMTLNRRPTIRYAIGCVGLLTTLAAPIVTFVLRPAPAPLALPSVVLFSPQREIVASALLIITKPAEIRSPKSTLAERADAWLLVGSPWITAGWFAGTSIVGLRHALGLAAIARLRRRATPVLDAVLVGRLARLGRRMKVRVSVAFLSSGAIDSPCVIGWLRPAILWPACALTGLTPLQLDALLAHELAHIRRHDYFINLLQTVVETLGFYHPAVWWLSRRVRQEREHCCDDIAAEIFGDRHGYARALVSLETSRGRPLSGVVASNGGSLMTRVRRLVAPARTSSALRPFPSPVLMTAVLCAAAICATFAYRTARAATGFPTTAPANIATKEAQVQSVAKRDLVMAGLVFRHDRLDAWIAQAKDHSQSQQEFDGLKQDRKAIAAMIAARMAELAAEPDNELRSPVDATYVELWDYVTNTRAGLAERLQSLPPDASERLELENMLRRADDALRRSEDRGGYSVSGDIERAGAYELPPDGITLKPAIDVAGGFVDAAAKNPSDAWILVTIPCRSDRTKESSVYVRWGEFTAAEHRPLFLLPGDSIHVGIKPPTTTRTAKTVIDPVNSVPVRLVRQVKALAAPANSSLAGDILKAQVAEDAPAANPFIDPAPAPQPATQPTTSPVSATASKVQRALSAAQAARTTALRKQMDRLRDQRADLKGGLPATVPGDLSTSADTMAAIARLLAERDSLRASLVQLEQKLGLEASPAVKTRQHLQSIEDQVEAIIEHFASDLSENLSVELMTGLNAGLDANLGSTQKIGPYYVSGAVTRPGVYKLSGGRVSVLQALIAAGHNTPTSVGVHITRRWPDPAAETKLAVEVDITDGKGTEVEVRPGDVIVVGSVTIDVLPTTTRTTLPAVPGKE
jgi:beta-lactamase regulating signal transducer with metallopeptidase domain